MDSSVFDEPEFLLRTTITGASGLTQKILANAAIAGIAALTTHQLTETALRDDHAFARRLLEQAASKVFGIMAVAQARAVEQPFGDAHGKSLGRGNTRRLRGNRV